MQAKFCRGKRAVTHSWQRLEVKLFADLLQHNSLGRRSCGSDQPFNRFELWLPAELKGLMMYRQNHL